MNCMQEMTKAFRYLLRRVIKTAFAICLGLCLIIAALGNHADAARTSMSGDYSTDTVSVAKSLRETLAIPNDNEERPAAQKESVRLITDYISRYRNRPQVNGSTSFTTMQTALKSMAGHYKTFSDRPLPEKLKNRLHKELTRAEKIVVKEI